MKGKGMRRKKCPIITLLLSLAASIALCFTLTSCGSGGGGGSASGDGTLSVSLTDATSGNYKTVYVTIDKVQVHMSDESGIDSWLLVSTPQKTYDLLQLINGVRQSLGLVNLSPGHYTQLRLIIGTTPDNSINILSHSHPFANYVIDENDQYHELKIPSGIQTGIKIVGGFDISANGTTELILDFNASQSVVEAGNSGNWLLKPTIKILNTADYSIINGHVTDVTDNESAIGVSVSAQLYNPGAADPKDRVTLQASTVTNSDGDYAIFIQPNTYSLVAYLDDFAPADTGITTTPAGVYTRNFDITKTDTGIVTGNVLITGGGSEQYATLSFRQTVTINGLNVVIEIKSLNILRNNSYTTVLPAGNYSIVVSSYGFPTQTYDITVIQNNQTTQDINL